jgi:hypothetical protein
MIPPVAVTNRRNELEWAGQQNGQAPADVQSKTSEVLGAAFRYTGAEKPYDRRKEDSEPHQCDDTGEGWS